MDISFVRRWQRLVNIVMGDVCGYTDEQLQSYAVELRRELQAPHMAGALLTDPFGMTCAQGQCSPMTAVQNTL